MSVFLSQGHAKTQDSLQEDMLVLRLPIRFVGFKIAKKICWFYNCQEDLLVLRLPLVETPMMDKEDILKTIKSC